MNINNNNKSKKVMNNRSVVKNTPVNNRNFLNKTVKYYPLKEVFSGGILNALGIKLDAKSIENYDKLLHNQVALQKIKSGLNNLTNVVVAPVVNNAVSQMEQPISDGIHKSEAALLNAGVSIIPGVSEVVNTTKSLSNAATAGLDTFTAVTDIATQGIEQIQEQAAELNPINQINNKIESAQTAVAENINNKVESAAQNINNKVASAQTAAVQKVLAGGSAKILSRIRKSVKQFMGKKRTNTAKNVIMKGGTYNNSNKNKNSIISQKGGQILSRIHKSLETFNNITY
jgi:hypothetical protein